MPKITKLRLHLLKLFRENYWLLFFPDTCALQVPLASGNDDGITVNSVADTVAEARCGVGLCYLLLSPSCQPSYPSVCLSRTHQAPDI